MSCCSLLTFATALSVVASSIAPAAAQSGEAPQAPMPQPTQAPLAPPTPPPPPSTALEPFPASMSNAPSMIAPSRHKLAAPARRGKDPLSPSTALQISLAGTAVGIAGLAFAAKIQNNGVGTFAVLVAATGPTWGRWYGHEAGIFTMATRFVGVGLIAALSGSDDEAPGGYIGFGVGLVLASTLYDFVRANNATVEFNDDYHKRRGRKATLAPAVLKTPNGAVATGLSLQGTF